MIYTYLKGALIVRNFKAESKVLGDILVWTEPVFIICCSAQVSVQVGAPWLQPQHLAPHSAYYHSTDDKYT